MAQHDTLAIVVTYNRIDKLRNCVAALRASVSPADILVVDNASTDETGSWLATEADGSALQVLSLSENIGGAGGFNKGMRLAVEHGYTYAWIMDDDCYVSPTALTTLLEADHLLNGDYGWLSSVALWTDGATCKMNKQKIASSFYDYFHLLNQSIIQVSQATFVSLFLRTSTIKEFGLPIKDFFIWDDDVEYTRRIAVRGKKRSFAIGKSTVTHAMNSNSSNSIHTADKTRISRFTLAYRNEFFLYRQEGIRGVAFYLTRTGFHFLKALFLSHNHRLLRCWSIIQGFGKGLTFNPEVEYVSEKKIDYGYTPLLHHNTAPQYSQTADPLPRFHTAARRH